MLQRPVCMVCCELVPVRAREIRSVPGPLRVRAAMAGRVHARRRSQRALIVERTWLWVAQTCCRPCDAACQNPLIGTVRQLRLARPPRDRRPPRAAGPQARPPRPRRRRIPRPPRLKAASAGTARVTTRRRHLCQAWMCANGERASPAGLSQPEVASGPRTGDTSAACTAVGGAFAGAAEPRLPLRLRAAFARVLPGVCPAEGGVCPRSRGGCAQTAPGSG